MRINPVTCITDNTVARYKPWAVYAILDITKRSELGIYTSRENAERDAGLYRRCLPRHAAVEVVWIGAEING